MSKLAAVLSSVALVLLLATSAQAVTFTVDRTADTAPGAGCLPTPAPCSLREAIQGANDNPGPDVVEVPGGTYVLTGGELVVGDELRVQRIGETRAVIDGDDLGRVIRATAPLTLTGLDVRNGRLTGGGTVQGAGIRATAALTLDDVTVEENAIVGSGGTTLGAGIAADGDLTITRSRVRGNLLSGGSTARGGGLYVDAAGGSTVEASRFTGNRVSAVNGWGGGLATAGGTLAVTRTTLDANRVEATAEARGGALAATGSGSLAVSTTTVVGNEATAIAGGTGPIAGGALWVQGSGTTVESTTITRNAVSGGSGADVAGGGIASSSDAVTIGVAGSIVAGNVQPNAAADCALATLASGGGNVLNQVDGAAGCRYTAGAGDVVTSDPGVGPLAAFGGAPQPVAPLVPGSPALDRSTTGCAGVDVRGVARPAGPACDSGAVEMRPATFTASPPSLSFGDVVTYRASAPQAVTLTNAGELPGVPSLGLAGPSAGQFTRSGCDASVAPGDDCTVNVWFAPTEYGLASATLTGTSSPVALDGTGVSPGLPGAPPPPAIALPALTLPATGSLPLPPRCGGHQLTLVELTRRGDDLAIRGLTRRNHAGRIVTLRAGTAILGTVMVRADGAFAARVPAPKGVASGRVRVTAEVAGRISQPFAVDRRTTIERRKARGGVLTVVARIRGAKPRSTVKLERRFGCGPARPYGRVRVGRGGRVTLSLPLPPVGADPVLYRASASVGRGVSYTLPLAVTPQG